MSDYEFFKLLVGDLLFYSSKDNVFDFCSVLLLNYARPIGKEKYKFLADVQVKSEETGVVATFERNSIYTHQELLETIENCSNGQEEATFYTFLTHTPNYAHSTHTA